jgi:hypothetical protein
LAAFVAAINLLLMRRPGKPKEPVRVVALIPARNEGDKIGALVKILREQNISVVVFNDESEDSTAEEARANGAVVMSPREPLPAGWLGKNRACHELARHALSKNADWLMFLDADVTPGERFAEGVAGMIEYAAPARRVVTGIPKLVPGAGIEPMFMAWVGWIILAFDPFGLVSRIGMGHVRFLNGQFQIWPGDVYARIMPHEQMRSEVMEDVMIGRLLAKEKVPVEVFQLADFLSVRMYANWRETLDGFSKNAYCITNSAIGTVLLAVFLAAVAVSSLVIPGCYPFLVLSAITVCLIAQAPIWPAFLMPIGLLIGSFTLIRSLIWHRTGRVRWKGRTVT